MTDEEIVLRNRQRTTLEYREHLTCVVLDNIKEGMSNDEWAVALGYGSALLKEQPNGGEGQDKEDHLFDEKRKQWSHAMRLAKQTQRPNSFRPPRYGSDDLSSQGSTRSDDSQPSL